MLLGIFIYLLNVLGLIKICAKKKESNQVGVNLVKRVVMMNRLLGVLGGKTAEERNKAAQARVKGLVGKLKGISQKPDKLADEEANN